MSAFGQSVLCDDAANAGKFPNLRPSMLAHFAAATRCPLKNKHFSYLARPVHWYWHGPDVGLVNKSTKGLPMFTSLSSVRESATMFAGAFITALLLVSAATSLPIA